MIMQQKSLEHGCVMIAIEALGFEVMTQTSVNVPLII
jgi:hypothetical protein